MSRAHNEGAHSNEGGCLVGRVSDLPVAAFSEARIGREPRGRDSVGPEAPGTGRPEVRPTEESPHTEMRQ